MNKKLIGIIVLILLGGIGAFLIYQNQDGGLFKGTFPRSSINPPSTVTLIPQTSTSGALPVPIDTDSTVTITPRSNPLHHDITIGDPDGIRNFNIYRQDGNIVVIGEPGNNSFHRCSTKRQLTTHTITNAWTNNNFPLTVSITDCQSGAGPQVHTVSRPVPVSIP